MINLFEKPSLEQIEKRIGFKLQKPSLDNIGPKSLLICFKTFEHQFESYYNKRINSNKTFNKITLNKKYIIKSTIIISKDDIRINLIDYHDNLILIIMETNLSELKEHFKIIC